MAPLLLIVGDPEGHGELQAAIEAAGYRTDRCPPRELIRRMVLGPPCDGLVACAGDSDLSVLIGGVRRSRRGGSLPIMVVGRIGDSVRDLADVLDLGADQFVAEPVDPEALEHALVELVGRPGGTGGRPSQRPQHGDLHATLDRVEARLGGDDHDRHLDALGPESIPHVEPEGATIDPGESEAHMPVLGGDGRLDALTEFAYQEAGEASDVDSEDTDLGARGRTSRPGRPEHPGSPPRPSSRPRPSRPAASWGVRPPMHMPTTGNITDVEVPRLLWQLHEAAYDGAVELDRRGERRTLWFASGELMFARSNEKRERLVDGLLERGALTRPQYETARRLAAKEPRRSGELLVDAGFIKQSELTRLVRDHLRSLVEASFTWHDGSYRLAEEATPDEPILIDSAVEAIILDGVRNRLDAADLRARLGSGVINPRLVADDARRAELVDRFDASLGLLPEERRWLSAFDGEHRLSDLLEIHDDEPGVLALVYTMHVIGRIELLGDPGAQPRRDPGRIDTERILERLRLARESDYFEFLGLGRDASRAQIRRQAKALADTFADESLEDAARTRYRSELQELRAALLEARDILVDEAMRSAYLAHLGDA